jgi:hypothetical protein
VHASRHKPFARVDDEKLKLDSDDDGRRSVLIQGREREGNTSAGSLETRCLSLTYEVFIPVPSSQNFTMLLQFFISKPQNG